MNSRKIIIILEGLLFILLVIILVQNIAGIIKVKAETDYFTEPQIIRCTCYHNHGITKSGQETRPHIAAGKEEWLGCVAMLYQVNEDGSMGDFIGYYEFTDTGAGMDTDGDGYGDTIMNGESIDVWQPTEQDCWDWVNTYGDYVYMKIVRGEG